MKQAIPTRPSRLAVAVGAALSLAGAQALATDRAGRVLAVSGTVVASTTGGGTRILDNGARIYTGETIDTRDGRVQIRFIDGALMTLEAETRFRVDEYERRDASAGDGDDGGSVFMSLLQGALRTISGAIGDDEDETYRMETPVATVGIRGTQYSLQMCQDGSCGEGVGDGLYGHVGSGQVPVSNSGGSGVFGQGQFFQVPDENQPPQGILEPPGQVLRGTDPDEDEEEDDDDTGVDDPDSDEDPDEDAEGDSNGDSDEDSGEDGGDAGEDDESGADAGPPPEDDDTGDDSFDDDEPEFSESEETGSDVAEDPDLLEPEDEETGPTELEDAGLAGAFVVDGLFDGGACNTGSTCTAAIDADGNVVVIDDVDGNTYNIPDDGVTLAKSGTVADIDALWGRWSGDIDVNGSLETGDFVWAYSTNPTTTAELESAFSNPSVFQFSLDSGPSPIGDVNDDWSVDTFTVDMSFSGGTADINLNDVSLDLSRPGEMIELINSSDAVTIDPGAGDLGFVLALESSLGVEGDEGEIEAVFAGDAAEGLLIEFEVTDWDSSAQNTIEDSIQGVKILLRQ